MKRRLPLGVLAVLFGFPFAQAWAGARAAQPRAAVTFLEAADQSRADLKSLRALLEEQLEQHDIKVVRKPAAPLISKSTRQMRPYARARRLDRIYDVRLRSVGDEKIEVMLTERKAPAMRSTFSAKLSAGKDRVKKVIPKLVGAVVARTEPEQETETAAQPQIQAQPEVQPQAAATPTATEPVAGKRHGEFLVGVSVDMGTYLHSAAGLYGATARLYYSWTALRIGLEAGGRGGGGTSVSFAVRSDYVFGRDWKISPYLGAGLGYLMVKDASKADGGGGYFSATLGAQYTRVRPVRFIAEAELSLPFFSAKREEINNVNGIVSLVDAAAWSPSALFKLGCLY